MSVKRLNYFTHQFLREQDFQAEQAYHVALRRQHNRLLHGWGVVEGFDVRKKSEREIVIDPGIAIDNLGREIVLATPVVRDFSNFERSSHGYATIAYAETWDEADHHSAGGVDGYTRVTESPEVSEKKHEPAKDGSVITLARVHLNENGNIHRIEKEVRTTLGTKSSAVGWMRLPFKPVRLEVLRIGEKLVPAKQWEPGIEFTVDVASAYCEKSARGSMAIPVPPGAAKVKAFRICGTTRGKVELELVRTGWNVDENKGGHKVLLKRTVEREWFDEHVPLEEELQPLNEFHSLAVSVIADGKTEIWLVAVRYE
ncbi:MAG: hypothetical protein WCA49_08060 [Candidatus Sulfotelmatobacter sp.]